MKSPDFDSVYFVGVRFSATGIGDRNVGVWAVNRSLDGTGMLLAVDDLAQEFYDGPDASGTQAEIDEGDPSVKPARACVA